MGRFCGKCGSPIDQTTGLCPKCGQQSAAYGQKAPGQNTAENGAGGARPTNYDAERVKAERAIKLAEEKSKKKEAKKRAWAAAKKRYKEDVAAKKAVIKKSKKEKKKAKLAAMSGKQKAARILLKLLIIVLILVLIGGALYLGLKNLGLFSDDDKQIGGDTSSSETSTTETDVPSDSVGSIGVNDPPSGDMPEDYEVSRPDADEFFKENSEIISEFDASTAGRTEAEAYKNLTDRGFTDMPITVQYTMDGTYGDAVEISSSGSEKHPIYMTYYITEDGYIWTIYEINGDVFANPVSYNLEYENNVKVMISETENITSYDSTLNKFYVTKPDESALDVKVVEKIDAETLDTLTAREINKL